VQVLESVTKTKYHIYEFQTICKVFTTKDLQVAYKKYFVAVILTTQEIGHMKSSRTRFHTVWRFVAVIILSQKTS
jgi:predicted double-glycine peptidase